MASLGLSSFPLLPLALGLALAFALRIPLLGLAFAFGADVEAGEGLGDVGAGDVGASDDGKSSAVEAAVDPEKSKPPKSFGVATMLGPRTGRGVEHHPEPHCHSRYVSELNCTTLRESWLGSSLNSGETLGIHGNINVCVCGSMWSISSI